MSITKFIIAAIAIMMGSWLAYDGTRALVLGDYVTPKTGLRAGRLGPWSRLVSAIGLAPRSRLVKTVHIILGACWLVSVAALFFRPSLGWHGLLVTSILSLWYLPVGTILGLIELCLLFVPHIRNPG